MRAKTASPQPDGALAHTLWIARRGTTWWGGPIQGPCPPRLVCVQGVIRPPVQEIVRLWEAEQLIPAPFRVQLRKQEPRKLVLPTFGQFRGSIKSLLEEFSHRYRPLREWRVIVWVVTRAERQPAPFNSILAVDLFEMQLVIATDQRAVDLT